MNLISVNAYNGFGFHGKSYLIIKYILPLNLCGFNVHLKTVKKVEMTVGLRYF